MLRLILTFTFSTVFLSACGKSPVESEVRTDFHQTRGSWTAKKLTCTHSTGRRENTVLPIGMKITIDESKVSGALTDRACNISFTGQIHQLTESRVTLQKVTRVCSRSCDPRLCENYPRTQTYGYRISGRELVLIQDKFSQGCDPAEIHFQRD